MDKSEKILSLQGVRALAIIGIFLSHTKRWLWYDHDEYELFDNVITELGPTGVFTFFIISGILLSYKNVSLQKYKFEDSIRVAWTKVRKLYILYFISLVISFIGKYPQTTKEWCWTLFSFPFNITLTQDLIPFAGVINSFNGPAWFLSSFYCVWIIICLRPALIIKINSSKLEYSQKLVVVILLLQTAYQWLCSLFPTNLLPIHEEVYMSWFTYTNPVLCYSELLLGCCLGRILREKQANIAIEIIGQPVILIMTILFFIAIPFSCILFQPIIEIIILLGIGLSWKTDSMGGGDFVKQGICHNRELQRIYFFGTRSCLLYSSSHFNRIHSCIMDVSCNCDYNYSNQLRIWSVFKQ